MKKKIAIIGSSNGQRPLYIISRKLGLHTVGFSWEKGAMCKDVTDTFYPISITEMDEIADICHYENVAGVVANGSTRTVEVADYISCKLGLDGTPYSVIQLIKDKAKVRELTKNIDELCNVNNYIYDGRGPHFLPCVVKPITGASKKGVSFVNTLDDFTNAIEYVKKFYDAPIMIEQYIEGCEVSVESISFRGHHYVIQITDKDSSGAPHFVELGHHQPSQLPNHLKEKIYRIIPRILDVLGFVTGATHTEFKISEDGQIYLIEINPRGGGDEISTKLVYLSSGYDYMKGLVEAAIGTFTEPVVPNNHFSGIYFLTKQTENLVDFFQNAPMKPWYVEGHVSSYNLEECVGNGFRNGYLIYQSDKKITPDD